MTVECQTDTSQPNGLFGQIGQYIVVCVTLKCLAARIPIVIGTEIFDSP